jgi:uncharacterized protein with HEPN domain
VKHSIEEIVRVAQSCKTYKEFYKEYSGYYRAALHLEVLGEVAEHLKREREPKFEAEPEVPRFM